MSFTSLDQLSSRAQIGFEFGHLSKIIAMIQSTLPSAINCKVSRSTLIFKVSISQPTLKMLSNSVHSVSELSISSFFIKDRLFLLKRKFILLPTNLGNSFPINDHRKQNFLA